MIICFSIKKELRAKRNIQKGAAKEGGRGLSMNQNTTFRDRTIIESAIEPEELISRFVPLKGADFRFCLFFV